MAERCSWLSGRAQEAVFMNVMSTLLYGPTFCALFLAVLAFLETGRLRSSLKRLHLDWRQLAVASMKWDAVVNAVVFGLVPLQLRVRASMSAQFIYIVLLAIWDHQRAIKYSSKSPAEVPGESAQDQPTALAGAGDAASYTDAAWDSALRHGDQHRRRDREGHTFFTGAARLAASSGREYYHSAVLLPWRHSRHRLEEADTDGWGRVGGGGMDWGSRYPRSLRAKTPTIRAGFGGGAAGGSGTRVAKAKFIQRPPQKGQISGEASGRHRNERTQSFTS